MASTSIEKLPEIVVPGSMTGWMRSNHAGETGAVWIYRGALATGWHPEVRRMAAEHGTTEQAHLAIMDTLVPREQRSCLLGLWRVMGFGLGAISALFGYRAFCITIEAVETFVERHYSEQIEGLQSDPAARGLSSVLEHCCAEEVEHQQDAARRQGGVSRGPLANGWAALVGSGSEVAVRLARRM